MNKRKVKKVLESASKNNIPYVIILGQTEVEENTIEIKDMKNSKVEKFNINDIEKILSYIKR